MLCIYSEEQCLIKHLHPPPYAESSSPHCTLVGGLTEQHFPLSSCLYFSAMSLNTNINAFISGAEL